MKKIKFDKNLIQAVMWGFFLAIPVITFIAITTLISWWLLYAILGIGITILIHGWFRTYGAKSFIEVIDRIILDINDDDDEDEDELSSNSIEPYW